VDDVIVMTSRERVLHWNGLGGVLKGVLYRDYPNSVNIGLT